MKCLSTQKVLIGKGNKYFFIFSPFQLKQRISFEINPALLAFA